jgi:hypothetical protein
MCCSIIGNNEAVGFIPPTLGRMPVFTTSIFSKKLK